MTDRIHCSGCGAESYAEGATLYCKSCVDRLKAEISRLTKILDAMNDAMYAWDFIPPAEALE